ncbi:SDR family oxidoreductase [Sulfitobacter sp. LCG007]
MTRCLVTGAGRRIGRAIALYLGARGHDVAVHYATSELEAEEVAQKVRLMERKSIALQADLLDDDQTEALFERATEALGGPIDCLVNNASIFEYDNIRTATRENWDRHIQSNLRAPFILTQAMARQGLETDTDPSGEPIASGLIVNVIDQRVLKPTPEYMTYSLAKMALWDLTRTSARALAPAIRVNAIGPGPTLRGEGQSETQWERQRAATVLGRGSNPEDVTAALGYFLDAPGVTGQLICTDGGQHLAWQTPDVMGRN